MKSIISKKRGFSLPELSVVMFLTTLITAVLVVFYGQSKLTLERGVQKTSLQQKVRLAAIRIVPKITSTFSVPPNPSIGTTRLPPIEWPSPNLAAEYAHQTTQPATNSDRTRYAEAVVRGGGEYNPQFDVGEPIVTLITTQEFVKKALREPVLPADVFNPRDPRYGKLELRFANLVPNPKSKAAGELDDVGDVIMRGYLNLDTDPDFETVTNEVVVASGLTNVTFLLYNDNKRVRLRVESQDYIPNATSNGVGERTVETEVYETDIFLPVYTTGD